MTKNEHKVIQRCDVRLGVRGRRVGAAGRVDGLRRWTRSRDENSTTSYEATLSGLRALERSEADDDG